MRFSEPWNLGWEQGETAPRTAKGVCMGMSLRREFVEFHAL